MDRKGEGNRLLGKLSFLLVIVGGFLEPFFALHRSLRLLGFFVLKVSTCVDIAIPLIRNVASIRIRLTPGLDLAGQIKTFISLVIHL